MPLLDITGQKFGRLTTIESIGSKWRFRCDCGGEIVRGGSEVKSGNTRSCGCLHREKVIERNRTHDLTYHPLYSLWSGIKARCLNPNHSAYDRYGGRGIQVCSRWLSFENFIADMGPRPPGASLDRINNDLGYEPSNCRWATRQEQSENTRRNRYLTVDGESLTVSQWARRLGVDQKTLNKRRALGWSDHDVIKRPIGARL